MDGTSESSVPVDSEIADEEIVAEDIQQPRTNHRKQCIIANLNINSMPIKLDQGMAGSESFRHSFNSRNEDWLDVP